MTNFICILLTGDIFGFSHFRTWEWDSLKPTRSIVFPFVSSGIPYLILNYFSSVFTVTTHSLLVFPRFWMTLLSLSNDLIIYKLAYRLFDDGNIANVASILYASSYTSWVFFTRTFSNSIETTLFGLLLCLVTSNYQSSSNENVNSEEHLQFRYYKAKSTSFLISAVAVAGVFTRVSFLVFMVVPLLYWLCRGIEMKKWTRTITVILSRCLDLVPGAVYATIFFVFCDTLYFRYESLLDIVHLFQAKNMTLLYSWVTKLPLTPLNSLLYNINSTNLEKHGFHPWFLHATVNMPLLFTPLVYILIPALSHTGIYLQNLGNQFSKQLLYILASSLVFSLGSLASVSHQEPRFLLPLIIPVTVLLSRCFHPLASRKLLVVLWVCFNLVYFIFFALLHQGGVVPSLDFVHSLSKANDHLSSGVDIIYYKTYIPPVHLAAISRKYLSRSRKFKIRDLAGSSQDILEATLESIIYESKSDIYLAFPASLPCSQIEKLRNQYLLEEQFSVFPHLSLENPPWSEEVCQYNSEKNLSTLIKIINRMTLNFYKVSPTRTLNRRDFVGTLTFIPSVIQSLAI